VHRVIRLVSTLVLLAPLLAAAQAGSYTVAGRVVGPQEFVLPDASVKLLGANRILLGEARTGDDGWFQFAGLPAGRYEFRVEAKGFSPYQRVLDVPADTAEPLKVELHLAPVAFQVTVTGRHGEPEETLVEPASVRLRGAEELRQRDGAHLPRMLAEEPGILTQETTPGQGSPILRGQGAQTVLYLLDGIRFNNSIYRSGNTQYLGWVPASATDSVEVFLGPAGAQYGSDALGGAINVLTALLPPWTDRGAQWSAENAIFFSSADLAAGNALRASLAGPRASLSLTGSWRRHQGLRSGGGEDSHNSLTRFFGFTPEQVRATLGSRLVDTDYAQSSWTAKLGARFAAHQFLTFAWVQAEQYGLRRYDRLLGGEGRLRHDLAPQRLGFGYARYQKLGTGKLRSLEATFSVNRQTDGQTLQTRETSPQDREINRVTALGYLFSTSWAPIRRHSLTAGAEFYDEFVFGQRTEQRSGQLPVPSRPRFPNGTRYQALGVYLSDDWEVVAEKMLVENGVRSSYFRFRTDAEKSARGGAPPVPTATETFRDVTIHSGFSWFVRREWVVFGRVARGFRAPSVFDLGELGLTGGGFEVPPEEAVRLGAQVGDSAAPDASSTRQPWQQLGAEVLWSFEGGLRGKLRQVSGDVTLFDSELFDGIERRTLIVPGTVVGETIGGQVITGQDQAGRIFVDADPRPVVSRANIGRVRLYGLESTVRASWTAQWSSAFKAAWQRGTELDTGHPARRVAPLFFFASLRWSHSRGRVWLEGFAEVSGPQERLNPAELADPRTGALRTASGIRDFFHTTAQRLGLIANDRLRLTGETVEQVIARVLGPAGEAQPLFVRTNGFATVNFRGSVTLNQRNELSFALLNLTDANYRRHGSGFDAPGINLQVSYRWRFR